MKTDYDIVILGAGLVGLAGLLALPAHLQSRTLLLDAAAEPGSPDALTPPGLDERGTALNRRSLEILQQWGVHEPLRKASGSIRHIEVSQAGYWGTTLLTDPHPMGAVVNNRHLGAAFWDAAQRTGAHTRFDTRVQALRMQPTACTLTLDNGQDLTCRLLLLADGNRSGLGTQLGLTERTHDYRQTAITFNIERERDCDGQAWERFGDGTARALLPLGGRRQSVIWVVRNAQSRQWLDNPDSDWARRIPREFGHAPGRVTDLSQRASYPLRMTRARELARPRLALLGNAALTLHPVAGQGFNLHLRAAQALGESLRETTDPGDPDALHTWQVATDARYNAMAQACHSLVTGFSGSSPLLSHVRGLGLAMTNGLPGPRARLMNFAMGFDEPNPRAGATP